MKAYVLNKVGGVENLVLSEIEQPNPKADEVLVELNHSGLKVQRFKNTD